VRVVVRGTSTIIDTTREGEKQKTRDLAEAGERGRSQQPREVDRSLREANCCEEPRRVTTGDSKAHASLSEFVESKD
jgi:hypothetical protein